MDLKNQIIFEADYKPTGENLTERITSFSDQADQKNTTEFPSSPPIETEQESFSLTTDSPNPFSSTTYQLSTSPQSLTISPKKLLFHQSLKRCRDIFERSEAMANPDIDLLERENTLSTLVDLILENLKSYKDIREHEFQKLTMLFLQALDRESVENLDVEKAIALRDAFYIYRNPRITEGDLADVRKIFRRAGLNIFRPLTGEFE